MVTYFNQDTGQTNMFNASNFTGNELNDDNVSATINITDLRLGTKYQFTVVAYTNVGPGSEAMITVSTSPAGKQLLVRYCSNVTSHCSIASD